ncbi:MAG: TolB family protein [Burkholderiales bacterium]
MRSLIALALVASTCACGGKTDTPGTTSPAGAPLAADQVVFDSTRASANREIFAMKTDGSGIQRLTSNSAYEHWWPRISPDRKKILFYRRPAGVTSDDYAQASLWVMSADGSGVTQLLAQGANGWSMQGHAEWSPDGTRIAMFGSFNATLQIFVTDATGGNPVRYTNQPGINTDVSWSPDGSKLLFNGCPASPCTPANYEIFVMSATAPLSVPTRLTSDGLADYDPYFSPDGSMVAWLTNTNPAANGGLGSWGIRMADIGGAPVISLSNVRTLIDDGQINSKPAWSLDGSALFFHRINFAEEARFGVFKIRSDGTQTQPSRLTPVGTGVNEFPAN